MQIKLDDVNLPLVISGFYGNPITNKRKESWEIMRKMKPTSPSPWLIMKDFNEILHPDEKFGGTMRPFSKVVEDCKLGDMGYVGPKFTWSNKRERRNFTKERLDRAFANSYFPPLFNYYEVKVLPAISSDHNPLLISCSNRQSKLESRPIKIFRYESIWSGKQECKDIIDSVWPSHREQRNPLCSFKVGLANCREKLQTLAKCNTGDTKGKVRAYMQKI